jgi:PAS domain S-box-containing protein
VVRERNRRIEEDRREMELILNSLGEGVVTIDRDFSIARANEAFVRLVGAASVDSVIGAKCHSVSHGHDRPCKEVGEDCPVETVFVTGRSATGVHVHRGRGGKEERVRIAAHPLKDRSGNVTRVVQVVESLESRRRVEEKFKTIFDMTNDAIFLLDMDGNFLDVNREAHRRLGYSRNEMLSMNVAQIDPPEFAARVPERLRELREKGQAVFESAHVRRDGTVMPVEVSARVLNFEGRPVFLSVIRDISRRKAAERELRESEEKYRNLFQHSNDAIFIHDLEGGIMNVNRRALDLFGHSLPQFQSLNVGDLHPEEDFAVSMEAFDAIVAEGYVNFDITFRRKDESTFPADVSSSLIELGGERFVQAIVRDISGRRAEEDAAREYARDLERMNHLKDLFTDILSHDLLNPASIVAHVSATLAAREHPRDVKEVEMIERNSRRILRLIKDASTYARVESEESLEKVERDLVAIVAASIEGLLPKMEEKGIQLKFEPRDEAPVVVNPMIEEVFENLISNAVKYSPEGSEIEVTIERKSDGMLVVVGDRGDGVPDEYKKNIFERFRRREKRGVLGSGLGLAIAARVTALHGGRIWVEDNPGGGSRFCVIVPNGEEKRG